MKIFRRCVRALIRCILGAICGLVCFALVSIIRESIAYQSGGWLVSIIRLSIKYRLGGWLALPHLEYPGAILALVSGVIAAQFWPRRTTQRNVKFPVGLESGKTVIVTVHGTGAAAEGDAGELWWQHGSSFIRRLEEEVGRELLVRPFHWSGDNSEIARRAAATELTLWLEYLEKARIPYHLIAHSHGGNVVWLALRRMLRKKRSVANLRSWITVGTPFYRFRFTPPDIAYFIPLAVMAAILLWPGSFPTPERMWRVTELMRPVMVAYGGQWVLPVLVLALLVIAALIAAFVVAESVFRLAASLRDSVRRQGDDRVYTMVSGRHVAIRSGQDEAITGLVGSLTIDHSDVRLVPRLPYLNKGVTGKLLSPILMPPIALYNLTVAPWFNSELRRKVSKRMQGNPFRYSEVHSVAGTLGDGPPTPGQLNTENERSLAELAAAGAAETIAGMRGALGVFATGADLTVFRQRLAKSATFNGLVHNSYFRCAGVVHMVAAQIRGDGLAEEDRLATPYLVARKSAIHWGRAVAIAVWLVGCYAATVFLYTTSVQPNTIAVKMADVMAQGERLARQVGGEENRTWYAVECVAGMCGTAGPKFDPNVRPTDRRSLQDEELTGLLEAIRWSSACNGAGCKHREELLAVLDQYLGNGDHFLFRRQELEQVAKERFFLTPVEKLSLVAERLGGLRQTPPPSSEVKLPFTPVPEEQYRSLISRTASEAVEFEKEGSSADRKADLISELYYLQPLFDLSLTKERMKEWDQGVDAVARFDNKLRLAARMHCGYERDVEPRSSELMWRAVRPLERIEAEISGNYLWWGECKQHAAVAKTALLAAEADWAAARTQPGAVLRSARFLTAIDRLRYDLFKTDRDAPVKDVRTLFDRVKESYTGSLPALIAGKNLTGLLTMLSERARSPIDGDPAEGVGVESEIIARTDWTRPPLRQLVDVLCGSARGGCDLPPGPELGEGDPRYAQLTETIVAKTARQAEVLMSADEAMFDFFRARGHLGLWTRYFDAFEQTRSAHSLRYMAYIDATTLMYEARELYGARAERPEFRNTYLITENLTLSDFSQARASMDVAGHSRIYSALTVAAVAGNRFHAAIEYASAIALPRERLRAFSEILSAWQAMREKIGDERLDELVDRGVATLDEARDNMIRLNPSHY